MGLERMNEKVDGKSRVAIFTDGSVRTNPGPGGWAALLLYLDDKRYELVDGNEPHATNNAMEIRACMEGLKALGDTRGKGYSVKVFTDSMYVVGTMMQGWKRRSNVMAFAMLDQLMDEHGAKFIHVKGHAKNRYNEAVHKASYKQSGIALAEQRALQTMEGQNNA